MNSIYIYYLADMLSKNRDIFWSVFFLSLLTILAYLIFFFYWWCNFESEKKNHTVYERSHIVNSFSWNVSAMRQPNRIFSLFFLSHTNAHSLFLLFSLHLACSSCSSRFFSCSLWLLTVGRILYSVLFFLLELSLL